MSTGPLGDEEVATSRFLHAAGMTPAAIALWLGGSGIAGSAPRRPPWQARGIVQAGVAADHGSAPSRPPLPLTELGVTPAHAGAAMMGRCFAAMAERGYLFSDLHIGNFLFDGEYGVVADIGDDVTGDDLVGSIVNQLKLLEPSWGPLFSPFAVGCLLALDSCWGWDSAAALARVDEAFAIERHRATVQQASSAILAAVERGRWATSHDDLAAWVAAAAALRLSGRSLPEETLRAIQRTADDETAPLDVATEAWLVALLRDAHVERPEPSAMLIVARDASLPHRPGSPELRRLELLVVGSMYRLLRRSFWKLSTEQLESAVNMHALIQPHLAAGSLREAEAELNALVHVPVARAHHADLPRLARCVNAAACNDLVVFERSLRDHRGEEPPAVLWNLAWRSLCSVRDLHATFGRDVHVLDAARSAESLPAVLATHARIIQAIRDVVDALAAKNLWAPWVAATRLPPNFASESEWITVALRLLAQHASAAELRAHWASLRAASNLDMDPLRILDAATTTDGQAIPWSELSKRWKGPVLVPLVKQTFDWHQTDSEASAAASSSAVAHEWPVPEALLRSPVRLTEPTFSRTDALDEFAHFLFAAVRAQDFPRDRSELTAMRDKGTQMRAFRAGGLLLFTFDVTQADAAAEFCDRVREPVRRPPPELASVAASQRILAHGVHRITVTSAERSPGATSDVGWYVAAPERP